MCREMRGTVTSDVWCDAKPGGFNGQQSTKNVVLQLCLNSSFLKPCHLENPSVCYAAWFLKTSPKL